MEQLIRDRTPAGTADRANHARHAKAPTPTPGPLQSSRRHRTSSPGRPRQSSTHVRGSIHFEVEAWDVCCWRADGCLRSKVRNLDVPVTENQSSDPLQAFFDGDPAAEQVSVEDSAKQVGERIAAARAAAGHTRAEVANQVGVKTSTLRKWESGTSSPRSNHLAALAGILSVSLSWLIVGYGVEPSATDDFDEVRAAVSRLHTQLAESLREVEVLADRLNNPLPAG